MGAEGAGRRRPPRRHRASKLCPSPTRSSKRSVESPSTRPSSGSWRAAKTRATAGGSTTPWRRGCGVEGIILGCTELPLLLREHAEAADLLNPAQLLAEAAVQLALD